jgi:hypothetical protein
MVLFYHSERLHTSKPPLQFVNRQLQLPIFSALFNNQALSCRLRRQLNVLGG